MLITTSQHGRFSSHSEYFQLVSLLKSACSDIRPCVRLHFEDELSHSSISGEAGIILTNCVKIDCEELLTKCLIISLNISVMPETTRWN